MPSRKRARKNRARRDADDRAVPFPVDVEDRGDEYRVSADLPGLDKQNLDISVRKNRVRITADYRGETDGAYHRRERTRGVVSRIVELPDWVDEKHVIAGYDDGVLRVRLRKRRRARRVDIE